MKLIGAENEYTVFFRNSGIFGYNSKTETVIPEFNWHLAQKEHSPILYKKSSSVIAAVTPLYDCWLKNGGRVYLDRQYTEYATPECETIKELTLAERAGERIITKIFSNLEQESLYILKRTSSAEFHNIRQKEKTGGSHENYEINKDLFGKLTAKQYNLTNEQIILIGHIASRIIYTGAGHISAKKADDSWDNLNFFISPRAVFLKSLVADETLANRPFINCRNESFSNNNSRLHLICGDTNRSDWSLYLKYGITALILTFMETADSEDVDKLAQYLKISSPRGFIIALSGKFSSNFSGEQSRFQKAIDMQIRIISAMYKYRVKMEQILPETEKIISQWETVINSLATGDGYFNDKLDWLIKKKIYEEIFASPIKDLSKISDKRLIRRLLQYDLSYHRVNQKDLFSKFVKKGYISQIHSIGEEIIRVNQPPKGKAKRRTQILDYIKTQNLENFIVNDQLWKSIELRQTINSSPDLGAGTDYSIEGTVIALDSEDMEMLKLKIDKFKKKIGG